MKEDLRNTMEFLTANGGVFYSLTMIAVAIILCLSILIGYKKQEKTLARFMDEGDEPLARWEYLVAVYAPKLIGGCVFSLILMLLVAAPYSIIRNFA